MQVQILDLLRAQYKQLRRRGAEWVDSMNENIFISIRYGRRRGIKCDGRRVRTLLRRH